MIAIKDNRQYTINETDAQNFAKDGFDVYDNDGNLVAYGVGKMVSYPKYMKALEQIEKLQNEIVDLKETIKGLEAKKTVRQKKED